MWIKTERDVWVNTDNYNTIRIIKDYPDGYFKVVLYDVPYSLYGEVLRKFKTYKKALQYVFALLL